MYLQKGHHTVKSIRQRETISLKPRRCVHNYVDSNFIDLQASSKCLGQIKLKSNLLEIRVLVECQSYY